MTFKWSKKFFLDFLWYFCTEIKWRAKFSKMFMDMIMWLLPLSKVSEAFQAAKTPISNVNYWKYPTMHLNCLLNGKLLGPKSYLSKALLLVPLMTKLPSKLLSLRVLIRRWPCSSFRIFSSLEIFHQLFPFHFHFIETIFDSLEISWIFFIEIEKLFTKNASFGILGTKNVNEILAINFWQFLKSRIFVRKRLKSKTVFGSTLK